MMYWTEDDDRHMTRISAERKIWVYLLFGSYRMAYSTPLRKGLYEGINLNTDDLDTAKKQALIYYVRVMNEEANDIHKNIAYVLERMG